MCEMEVECEDKGNQEVQETMGPMMRVSEHGEEEEEHGGGGVVVQVPFLPISGVLLSCVLFG